MPFDMERPGLLARYFDSFHSSSGEIISTTIHVTAFVTQRTKTYESARRGISLGEIVSQAHFP